MLGDDLRRMQHGPTGGEDRKGRELGRALERSDVAVVDAGHAFAELEIHARVESRLTKVPVDRHDFMAEEGERPGEAGGDRGLSLAARGRGDRDRTDFAARERELEVRDQSLIGLRDRGVLRIGEQLGWAAGEPALGGDLPEDLEAETL